MSDTIKQIGYIGMGIMGRPMANNLLKAGYDVSVWNRTASKCSELTKAGASQADTPKAMAEAGPQVIFINVTDTPDVERVLFADDGVAAGAKDGLIVVDNSTISPVATQDFAKRLAKLGVTLIDAPVSGGDTGAQKGTLSIMVGGEEKAFNTVKPLLEVLGSRVTLLGGSGMGQACKACNQVAVSVNLLGVIEALALAKKSGLDLHKMVEVVSSGAGGSWQLENLGPKIADGDHAPGFMIDLVLKDLGIVSDTAREHSLPLSGTSLAEAYFKAAQSHGAGDRGTQAMAQAVEHLANLKFDK